MRLRHALTAALVLSNVSLLARATEVGPLHEGEALNSNEFWSMTGAAGEGYLFTFGPDPRLKPEAQSVVEAFRKTGYDPEGYTLCADAAIQVWAAAALASRIPACSAHKRTWSGAVR